MASNLKDGPLPPKIAKTHMTRAEAMEKLGISCRTFWRWCEKGVLKKTYHKARVIVSRASVERHIKSLSRNL